MRRTPWPHPPPTTTSPAWSPTRQLAITLVRKTIGSIQQDGDAKMRVREKYEEDPMMLMRAAELVALEFRVIAEANDYWRDRGAARGD